MKRSVIYFAAGFLACLGSLVLLSRVGIIHNKLLDAMTGYESTTVKLVSDLPSPNLQYVATTNKVGNGTGWCEVRINVHKKDEVFDWEHDFVCITGCDTKLDLKWEDEKHLTVSYSAGDVAKGVHTYQQFRSKDSLVSIAYLLEP